MELKSVRRNLGLSQTALANMLGVSRSTVNMAEHGKRLLPHSAIVKIGKLAIDRNQKVNEIPHPIAKEKFDSVKNTLVQKMIAQSDHYKNELDSLTKKRDKINSANKNAWATLTLVQNELIIFSELDNYAEKLLLKKAAILHDYEKTHADMHKELDWRIQELSVLIQCAEENIFSLISQE